MNFRFCHNNFNVLDLEKSIAFYEKALGLKEVKRKTAERKNSCRPIADAFVTSVHEKGRNRDER